MCSLKIYFWRIKMSVYTMSDMVVGYKFRFKKEKFDNVKKIEVRHDSLKKGVPSVFYSDFFNNRNHIENNDIVTVRKVEPNRIYFSVNSRKKFLYTSYDEFMSLIKNHFFTMI